MTMTRSKTSLASLALLCGFGLLVMACPASLDDFCADGACAPRAASAEGGGMDADAGVDAPVTDPCINNPTALSCLDETTALFVSNLNGNDQDPAAGSRAKPFKTINAAIARINAVRRRIYVCEGPYFEDIALNATHSSLSIFGGVDCAWNANDAIKPIIGASANPLKIDGTVALAFADVAIVAKDATAGSSIAAFVNGGDTTLKRVRLSAGKGADAKDAELVPFTNFPVQADLNGVMAPDMTNGGSGGKYMCPGGLNTAGGKGGNAGNPGEPGTPGPANGGLVSNCSGNVTGATGSAGQNGTGALTAGELRADGWFATAGMPGATGGPGQGGGGGFGVMGAGGGGGAGGCGGAGGAGGTGGGASIALAVYLANVSVETSTLEAKLAGRGAKGSVGQNGQTIFGFRGTGSGNACNGGAGGPGANGGIGGGGAGGSSLGFVYKGPRPTLDAKTEGAISSGNRGSGGAPAGGLAGVDGSQGNELKLQ
jgi:hypothetical protein